MDFDTHNVDRTQENSDEEVHDNEATFKTIHSSMKRKQSTAFLQRISVIRDIPIINKQGKEFRNSNPNAAKKAGHRYIIPPLLPRTPTSMNKIELEAMRRHRELEEILRENEMEVMRQKLKKSRKHGLQSIHQLTDSIYQEPLNDEEQ